MVEGLLIAGNVLVPLGFGLIPGFLPPRLSSEMRWGLWLGLLGLASGYVYLLGEAPFPFQLLALLAVSISALLSLTLMIRRTRTPKAKRRRRAEAA